MYATTFHPDVKVEVQKSYDWYQKQSLGLGDEFIGELEKSFALIAANPARWSRFGSTHRRFVLGRFPYSIIYQLSDQQLIFVVAVMHNHRKPGYWSRRS